MQSLKFLDKIDRNALKLENKIYRGAIPWFLLCSNEKKIVYVSTSNRNLENYYSMLEGYSGDMEKDLSIFENTSSNKEDLTGINIEIVEGFKKSIKYIPFPGVLKEVIFFIGITEEEKVTIDKNEIEDYMWCTYGEALKMITYKPQRDIMESSL